MGVPEAMAILGTGYVLTALYTALSCVEARCQAMWTPSERRGRGGTRRYGTVPRGRTGGRTRRRADRKPGFRRR